LVVPAGGERQGVRGYDIFMGSEYIGIGGDLKAPPKERKK
jgi:hypothetical protein